MGTPAPTTAKKGIETMIPVVVDTSVVRSRFKDILNGLNYLHMKNVIHMDIKPENVLLDAHGVCKLADFGVCSVLEQSDVIRTKMGTPIFFSPEKINHPEFHGRATDVWALGVTMYIYVYGAYPFPGETLQEISSNIAETDVVCGPITGDSADLVVDVLYRMLCRQPCLRITVPELIAHPFFAQAASPPLAWSVRMWKEARLEMCRDLATLKAVSSRTKLKDTTDQKGVRFITDEMLEMTPLYANLARRENIQCSVINSQYKRL